MDISSATPRTSTHRYNRNFWIFGLFFFLYFFIMATCFPFLRSGWRR